MSGPGNEKPGDFERNSGNPFMNLDWDIDRVLSTLRPLVATQATTDALLMTTSVAALLPVLQSTMSFVMAATHTYQTTHREDANLHAASMPLLTESVRQIFSGPRREASVVGTAAYLNQPQQLAVT